MSQPELERVFLLGREVVEERYAIESKWKAERFPFRAEIKEVRKENFMFQGPGIYWELWPVEALSNGGRTALGKGKSANIQEASTELELKARALMTEMTWFLGPSTRFIGVDWGTDEGQS